MPKIYVIDYIGNDVYEVYGSIGFKRYYGVSRNEAKKKYSHDRESVIVITGGNENGNEKL